MRTLVLFLLLPAAAYGVDVGPEGIDAQGEYMRAVVTPGNGAAIDELRLVATGDDVAGPAGLLSEGFGVGTLYAPNRRLDESLRIVEDAASHPVFVYAYTCEGPNIAGLHVTRRMELPVEEASLRVTWTIANRGEEAQWVAPWVRCDARPGGGLEPRDRIDLPTVRGGAHGVEESGWALAARNWAAVTDPEAQQTVYGVFDAEQVHSFLAIREVEDGLLGFQAAFAPFLLAPGDEWTTRYRVNVARGLQRVHFATDELAAEVRHDPGMLRVLLAGVVETPSLVMRTSVLAPNGRRWKLAGRRVRPRPNTVIRASMPWEPIGDGAYDILAQLERADTPWPLGDDTASPHGGIDTQFVVGARERPMAAWTGAPTRLDRGARTLERALVTPGDVAMWFESPLEKLFPADKVRSTGAYRRTWRVQLARNERESFQLGVRPPEGGTLEGLRVHVNPLIHADGDARIPAADIAVRRAGLVDVRVPSHFETPTGPYPDPLLPFERLDLRGGETTALWFTVRGDEDLPAGVYTGMVEVSARGMEPVELFLEVEVYDFTLPVRPALKTAFGFWSEAAYARSRDAGWDGTREALDAAYVANALDHRVTLHDLVRIPAPATAVTTGEAYAAALEGFAPRLGTWRRAGASAVFVPRELEGRPDLMAVAGDFLAGHGFDDHAYTLLATLPRRPAWDRVMARAARWREGTDAVRPLVPTQGLPPFLPDALDVWTVHLPLLDTPNLRPILDRVRAGGEVWWFVNHEPSRPYGNLFVDFAGIEHRILFWQAWVLGIRGMYYHGVNIRAPGVDPYAGLLDPTPANGNAFLVYPGADGPVDSIRWETVRDGIEDYDYLVLFQEALRARARAGEDGPLLREAREAGNLGALLPDLVRFPRDPSALTSKRDEIARMIVALAPSD